MTPEKFITKISLSDFLRKKNDFFYKNRNRLIVIKKAVNKKKIRNIVYKIVKTRKNYVKKPLIVEGVKNISWLSNFKIKEKNQYSTVDKSWYFFPWNKDNTGIISITHALFKKVIELNGYNPNKIEKNTPKDKIIKRIQLIFYPYGSGLISLHKDPINIIKMNAGIYVTEHKKDYDEGGFYIMKNKRKLFLDPFVKSGDLVLFRPNMVHAVDPVFRNKSNKKSMFKGRCFLNMAMVQSHEVKKRVYTKGVQSIK